MKQSGKNIQKKLAKDGSGYNRVKSSLKTHAQRTSRRKLNNPKSFDEQGKDTKEDIASNVLRLLHARHQGDVRVAKAQIKYLKAKLGDGYEKVLMKHGDPDRGDFERVVKAWEGEL